MAKKGRKKFIHKTCYSLGCIFFYIIPTSYSYSHIKPGQFAICRCLPQILLYCTLKHMRF